MYSPGAESWSTLSSQLSEANQLSRVQANLMATANMNLAKRQQASSRRFYAFLLSVVFFIAAKYVMLRTEYHALFTIWQQNSKSNGAGACAMQFDFSPWNIALNRSYPWLGRVIVENPLSQGQAQFLWYVIKSGILPTKDTLSQDFAGYGLSPLDYLCGNVFSIWSQKTGSTIDDLVKNPANSPWKYFLNSQSKILSDTAKLSIFTNGGFFAAAQWVGGDSPNVIYDFIFAAKPPSTCDSGNQIMSAVTNATTLGFAADMLFKTPIVGVIAGLGLSLFGGSSSQC